MDDLHIDNFDVTTHKWEMGERSSFHGRQYTSIYSAELPHYLGPLLWIVTGDDITSIVIATPDLLKAAKLALSVIQANHPCEASEFLAIKELEAAIAKAEGR